MFINQAYALVSAYTDVNVFSIIMYNVLVSANTDVNVFSICTMLQQFFDCNTADSVPLSISVLKLRQNDRRCQLR